MDPSDREPGIDIRVFLDHATIAVMTEEEWDRLWKAHGTVVRIAGIARLRREQEAKPGEMKKVE